MFLTYFHEKNNTAKPSEAMYVDGVQTLNKMLRENASKQGNPPYISFSVWDGAHNGDAHKCATAAILEYSFKANAVEIERKASALPYLCYSVQTVDGMALVFPFAANNVFFSNYTRLVSILASLVGEKHLAAGSGAATFVIQPSPLPRAKALNDAQPISIDAINDHRANPSIVLLEHWVDKKRYTQPIAATRRQPQPAIAQPVTNSNRDISDWFDGDGQARIENAAIKPNKQKTYTPKATLDDLFDAVDDVYDSIEYHLQDIKSSLKTINNKMEKDK